MNILGKLPESFSSAKEIDYVGLLKVLRLSLITGAAAVVGFLITAVPGLDLMPNSTIDTTIITLFLVPGLGGSLPLFGGLFDGLMRRCAFWTARLVILYVSLHPIVVNSTVIF